jgi:hypothetical protein
MDPPLTRLTAMWWTCFTAARELGFTVGSEACFVKIVLEFSGKST